MVMVWHVLCGSWEAFCCLCFLWVIWSMCICNMKERIVFFLNVASILDFMSLMTQMYTLLLFCKKLKTWNVLRLILFLWVYFNILNILKNKYESAKRFFFLLILEFRLYQNKASKPTKKNGTNSWTGKYISEIRKSTERLKTRLEKMVGIKTREASCLFQVWNWLTCHVHFSCLLFLFSFNTRKRHVPNGQT